MGEHWEPRSFVCFWYYDVVSLPLTPRVQNADTFFAPARYIRAAITAVGASADTRLILSVGGVV